MRVVVVGGGVGGLCAAAHLASAGCEVVVVEKNARTGGRCDRIELDGHRFDTGPTLFVLPELYRAELAELGLDMAEELTLLRVEPTYQVVFEDGDTLAMTSDVTRMRSQLEAIEPGAGDGFARYLDEARVHYHRAMDEFVRKDFRSLMQLARGSQLLALMELRLLLRHYRHVGRFFASDRLRAAFTYQDLYMGLSPADAPATFSMIPYSELTHGVWYPEGGMRRVVDVLERVARERGADVRVRTAVRRIVTDGKLTTGVELEEGEVLDADVVLANADLPYVIEELLPPTAGGRMAERRPMSYSSMSFFWTARERVPGLSTHNLFLADDYLEGFRQIGRGRTLPANPSLYVHAPTRIDESMAPVGRDTLIVVVPVGNMSATDDTDWAAFRDTARERVFDRLVRAGFGAVPDAIDGEVAFTPPSWRKRYNLKHGASHGLGHQLWQLGGLRPHNRHTKYRNLYFAGASTHPGSGVPTAMVSGRLAAERILEERAGRVGR